MSSLEENMEDILNIETEVVEESKPIKPVPPKIDKDDKTKDYEYTRGELYSLIDQGQEAVRGALEVAQESGHPRAYEVAVAAMKHVADMTEKLQDLHKKMKDLDAEAKKGPSSVTNNAMFVGSTTELQKMLKEMGGGKR
nr:DNA terminase packaging enzyme small subunit [uncultured Mediterranean phage uvMED]BAR27679.1 DNA terminase packaging enzyme small subunit [uncultured Mediterranean phage uvMED]|tara:strand:+ start:11031 stop:11447 length:417 start_codon:yes stop_codon:yes gene_type:complete